MKKINIWFINNKMKKKKNTYKATEVVAGRIIVY